MTAATTTSAMALRNHPVRGIIYLCLGVFAFALHDVAVKLVSGDYPLSQVMFIRSLAAMPLMLLLVHFDAGLPALLGRRAGLLLLRAMLLLLGYLCYYLAFAAIPFTDAVALYSTVPLIIVALAGPLLGERVGVLRWLAVAVGFMGVLVMLQPGRSVFEPAGLLILLCALLYSLGMIFGRSLGASVPGSVIASYTTFVFLLAAVLMWAVFGVFDFGPLAHPSLAFLLRPWAMPDASDLLVMISCGLTAAAGVTGLTFAYREAEANLVASFEYTALVWAAILGFLVWHEVPKLSTVMGAALIVGAGLVAMAAGRIRRNSA
jgi:drug/metabolite transporter (DMT)-like permease